MIGAVLSTIVALVVVPLVALVVLLMIRDFHSAAGVRAVRPESTRRLRRELDRHK